MDFDVGDVVVCVNDRRIVPGSPRPTVVRGDIYRVTRLATSICGKPVVGVDGIEVIKAKGSRWMHCATRFRKLPKADDTFTAEMRALRPHREKLPA